MNISKRLNFEIKEQMVTLSGACFWFWGEYHSFLKSCGVSQALLNRFPKSAFTKYDVMRNILETLESVNDNTTIQNIVSGYFRLTTPIDRDHLDIDRAKKLLRKFRESVGNDPIERAIREQESQKERTEERLKSQETQAKAKKLDEIRTQFLKLHEGNDITPQKRGFEMEKLFFQLIALEEIEHSKPYKTKDEQVDGHFKYDKFDYLVEIKWLRGHVKKPDVFVMEGRIRSKAQSTRGFFLSINGFDESVVEHISGDSPRIILMEGREIMNILEARRSFDDTLKSKVDALVRFGDVLRID